MTIGAQRMARAAEKASLAAHKAMGEVIMASFDTKDDADNARCYGAALTAATTLYAGVLKMAVQNKGLAKLASDFFDEMVMPEIGRARDMVMQGGGE